VGKVLAQAGTSLADIYDVEGSIAGVEEIETREVQAVHEMGQAIFSERLRARVITTASAATAQSLNIDVAILAFADIPFIRVHGIFVFTSVTARLTRMAVMIEDAISAGNGLPIWVWDGNEESVRTSVGGSAVNTISLDGMPQYSMLPSFMVGQTRRGQEVSPNLTLRGSTSAFGAGTVTVTCHTLISFPTLGGVSSRGLPVPGW